METRSIRGRRAGRLTGQRIGNGGDRPSAGDLEALRGLVIGPEQARLTRLEAQATLSAEAVGGMLPEATAWTAEHRAKQMAIALEPAVTTVVRTFARREADLFGDILAPTIGAAVRKAVADAISVMLLRFNEALERSLSIQSVRWRIEARRTSRPFAEVVLLHTLVYSVEQVFLIHPGSGLVLNHVVAQGAAVRDPDQVAAMLEAINSFMREAFKPQPSSVHLTHLRVGDLTVFVDRDPSLAVAAVVHGVAPPEFSESLREVRERIYLSHRKELLDFHSDVSPFSTARSTLEGCLCSVRHAPPGRAHIWLAIAAALIVLGIGLLFSMRHARAGEQARTLNTYVETLQAEPGIAITSAQRVDGHVRIAGFRDPLARSPEELLIRRGLLPAELRFQPFYSLDPRIAEQRVRRSLRPPRGVTVTLHDGVLRATGIAPHSWIEQTGMLARTLPAVERYEDRGLVDEAAIQAQRAAAALETTEIHFAPGSTALTTSTVIGHAASLLRELTEAAATAHLIFCVSVLGHADPTGTIASNHRLSQARAVSVVNGLSASDLRPGHLRPIGAGMWVDAGSEARARSATFRVDLGSSCPEGR